MKRSTKKRIKTRLVFVLAILLVTVSALLLSACSVAVKNGDFSELTSNKLPKNWTYNSYISSGSTVSVVKDTDGVNMVKIVNKTANDTRFYQEIPVRPNAIYKFTAYVKTEDVKNGAGANIGLEDFTCYSNSVYGTTDWQIVQLIGKTGSNQTSVKVGIRLGNYGGSCTGTAYFRNFSCEKLASYNGALKSLDNSSNSSNSAADAAQIKARYITAAFTIIVFAIVPLAVGFIIWYEHAAEKRSKIKRGKTPAQLAPSIFDAKVNALPTKTDTRLHYTKLDWIFVCVLTAVYAVLAVTNLGSLKVPDKEWKGAYGAKVTFEFDKETAIGEIWQHGGITGNSKSWNAPATYTLSAPNGEIAKGEQSFDIMYRWNKLNVTNKDLKTKTVTLEVTSSGSDKIVWLNEIAFFDTEGNLIPVTVQNETDKALVDEQDCVPEYPNYMNGMYFDELYHARTAYENIHNMPVYEISHPPLGKLIISLGIRIFGMKPFGWRIMGALFGVLMVPLMYAFGKRMFKRPGLALLAAALMTFDFMHYTQTRIATIDSYAVFFNLCMTYYMYKFIKMDLADSLGSTLIPLGLSGIFFGLGCSSKWICIYTGAALAVMFFTKMIVQWFKARNITKNKRTKEEMETEAYKNAKDYPARFLKTILFCIPFFIIIPAMIYFASYRPYYTAKWKANAERNAIAEMRANGQLSAEDPDPEDPLTFTQKVKTYIDGVIENQKSMFSYHSKLSSTHPFESKWYEWPLSNRPMWFYAGYNNPDNTLYGTISSFGNPAVWWLCFVGTVFFLFLTLRGRFKVNTEVFFILCCMASSFIPWVLISRSVYIYHYFATVPMIILASVYVVKHYEDAYCYVPMEEASLNAGKKKEDEMQIKPKKWVPYLKFVWIAAAIGLFILFYPVLTGIPAKKTFIESLQWLPTWTFMGSWPSLFSR